MKTWTLKGKASHQLCRDGIVLPLKECTRECLLLVSSQEVMDWLATSLMLNVVTMNESMHWIVHQYSIIIKTEIMEHAVVIFTKMKRRPKCFKQNVLAKLCTLLSYVWDKKFDEPFQMKFKSSFIILHCLQKFTENFSKVG